MLGNEMSPRASVMQVGQVVKADSRMQPRQALSAADSRSGSPRLRRHLLLTSALVSSALISGPVLTSPARAQSATGGDGQAGVISGTIGVGGGGGGGGAGAALIAYPGPGNLWYGGAGGAGGDVQPGGVAGSTGGSGQANGITSNSGGTGGSVGSDTSTGGAGGEGAGGAFGGGGQPAQTAAWAAGGSGGGGGAGVIITAVEEYDLDDAMVGGTGGVGGSINATGAFTGYTVITGNGGTGGSGLVIAAAATVTNASSFDVLGGAGGDAGGDGLALGAISILQGKGGDGGAAIVLSADGIDFSNAGIAKGGTGGSVSSSDVNQMSGSAGAGGAGVLISGNDSIVSNSGTFQGGDGGNWYSTGQGKSGIGLVVSGDSNTITNQKFAGIYGADIISGKIGVDYGGNAVLLSGTGNTITNYGFVEAGLDDPQGRGGAGVFVTGSSNKIINDGNIISTNGVGVYFDTTSVGSALELWSNWGLVGGAVNAGTNTTLALGGTVNQSFDLTLINSTFVDFNAYEKVGTSTWEFTGTTGSSGPASNWTVKEGILALGTGTWLKGDVTVASGGTLNATTASNGTAKIEGLLLVQSGGIVNAQQGAAGSGGATPINTDTFTLNTGAIVNIGLISVGADAAITSGGALTIQSGVTINLTGTTLVEGTYNLIEYSGAGGTFVLPTVGTVSGGLEGVISTTTRSLGNMLILTLSEGGLYWNGTTTSGSGPLVGGGGTWTASSGVLNWSNADGTTHVASNATKTAIFSATAGIVTIDDSSGAVGAKGLTFLTSGYEITGAALTLANVSAAPTVDVDGAGSLATIASALAGSDGLEKIGDGTLILTGANTYTGGTTVSGGTLSIGDGGSTGSLVGNITNSGILIFNRSDDLTYSGVISGSGKLEKRGAGTLTLTGTNGLTGQTTVSAGTLVLTGSLGGAVAVANGATLTGTGTVGGNLGLLSGGTFAGTSGATLTASGSLQTWHAKFNIALGTPTTTAVLSVGSSVYLDGTLNLTADAGFASGTYRLIDYAGNLTGAGLVLGTAPEYSLYVVDTSTTGQVNLQVAAAQWWNGSTVTAGSSVQGGDGTWTATGSDMNWTNATGSTASVWTQDSIPIFAGTAGTVTLSGSTAPEVAGMHFLTSGYTITGGAISLVAFNEQTPVITVGDATPETAGFTATIASDLSGSAGLVKDGAGTLILSGAKSLTGIVDVSAGTMVLSGGSVLASTTEVNLYTGATLELVDGSQALASLTGDGGTLKLNANTLTIGSDTTGGAFAGSITGTGGLTKVGSLTAWLVGTNTFTGPVHVVAGKLFLQNGSALADSVAVTIDAGTELVLRSSETIGSLAGAGNVIGAGGGYVLTTGGNNASTTFSGALMDGVAPSVLSLVKTGTGTLTLTGANTYTGTTTVSAGTLALSGGSLAGGVSVSSGATLQGGASQGTVSGIVEITAGGRLAGVSGTTSLSIGGNLSFAGPTSIFAVTLGSPGSTTAAIGVTGDLALNGELNLTAGTGFASGTYRLIDYAGTLSGTGLEIGTAPAHSLYAVSTSTANQVNLVVAAGQWWNGSTVVPGTSVQGGDGTWSVTNATTNWTNATGTTADAWSQAGLAIFAGTKGTVTVSGATAPQVAAMEFLVDGYVITGGSIELVGFGSSTEATVLVGEGPDAFEMSATIASALTGTVGLEKTGLGTLVLSGSNSYAGVTTVSAGTLKLTGTNTLSAGVYMTGGTLTIEGSGTLANTSGYIANGSGTTGTVVVTGADASWIGTGELGVGQGGQASFTVSAGAEASFANSYVGVLAGSNGTATVTGKDSIWTSTSAINVGYSGTGTVNVEAGGTLTGATGIVSAGAGAIGTVTVTGAGSTWTATTELGIGQSGTGTLNVAAGGRVNTGIGYIGVNAGAIGTATVTGEGSTWDNTAELHVGYSGTGTLTVEDTGHVSTVNAYVSTNSGSSGTLALKSGATASSSFTYIGVSTGANGSVTVTGADSLWTSSNDFVVGGSGSGQMTVSAGGGVSSGNGYIGLNALSTGTATVTGADSSWSTGSLDLFIGLNGTGTLNVADGGAVSAAHVTLGYGATGGGTLNLDGTDGARGILTTGQISKGAGQGSVNFNGGVVKASASQAAFLTGFADTTVTINAGGVTFDSNGFDIGVGSVLGGAGGLTKAGLGTLTLTAANSYTGGTTVSAGTLEIGNGGVTGSVLGAIANNATVAFNRSDDVVAAGAITGTGALVQKGGGKLTLVGANSAGAGTTVEAGTLEILSGVSLASNVTVTSGGTLQGETSGTSGAAIAGAVSVENGGTLAAAPVTTAGAYGLSMTALTLASSANIDVTLGSNTGNAVFSAGTLALDGVLNVTDGGSMALGVYRIIDYTTLASDDGLVLGTTPLHYAYEIQQAQGQVNLEVFEGGILYWNGSQTTPDGTIHGGDGTWTASSTDTNWTTFKANQARAWDASFAVFSGTAGEVTIDDTAGAVAVTGVQFMVDGYEVSGDALTLAAASGQTQIRVGDGTGAGAAYVATIGSVITGSTGLEKTDLGTLILAGTNTYTGGTTITQGILQIGNGGTTGAIEGDVVNNAALVFNRSDDLTYSGALSGTGSVTKQGAGTLLLGGTNNFSGGLTVKAGAVQVTAASALGTGGLALEGAGALRASESFLYGGAVTLSPVEGLGGGTFTVDDSKTLTLTGGIGGTGALTKSGTGDGRGGELSLDGPPRWRAAHRDVRGHLAVEHGAADGGQRGGADPDRRERDGGLAGRRGRCRPRRLLPDHRRRRHQLDLLGRGLGHGLPQQDRRGHADADRHEHP